MNFLGIGTGELLLILLIVLLVMGPERLPELVRQWAKVVKTLSQFTRTWQQFNAELNRQLNLEELAGKQTRPAAKPAPTPPASETESEPEPADNVIAPPELARQASPAAASQPAPDVAAPAANETDDLSPAASDASTAATEELHHEQ